jgi:Caspase domain
VKNRRSIQQAALGKSFSRSHIPGKNTKDKDAWDKIAVVASILSSVVLASFALFLNSTIQKTQLAIQTHQLEEAKENTKILARSQNAKSTTDLIQYLLSGDPPKQRVALVALRSAVQDDDDLVVNIVEVVASTSTDQDVFHEATETLQASRNPKVANILSQIADKESRGHNALRSAVAYQASQRVGVQAAAANGTTIIYGSPPGKAVFESIALGGGIFTQSLISTLEAAPGPIEEGALDLSSLPAFLDQKITDENTNQPHPFVVSSGASRIPLWAPATKDVKMLAIGVSQYAAKELPSLRFPAQDANRFAEVMRSHGASVSLLTDANATKKAILESIDRFATESEPGDTFILYFSGHGWNSRGIQQLAAADMKFFPQPETSPPPVSGDLQTKEIIKEILPSEVRGSLALSDVMRHVNRLPFRFKLVVIDACSTQ